MVVSDYQSTYPYSSSGKMPLPDDCRIPDPLDLMAYLAGVTERINLATGVLVLPNHQAVVLAKRIATVDVLSGGRVRMCVGVGWMDEELRATGADPRTRGRRTDETIAAMRALWADAGPAGAHVRRGVLLLPARPLVPQAGAPGRGAHPYRRPQRGRRPTGRPVGGRVPTARAGSRGPAAPPRAVGARRRKRPGATRRPSSCPCPATSRPPPSRRWPGRRRPARHDWWCRPR